MARQGGGVLLLVGVGLPSFLLLLGGERKGGRRTRLKDQTINCVSRGAPLPPYIKEQRGVRPAKGRGAPGGVLLLLGGGLLLGAP